MTIDLKNNKIYHYDKDYNLTEHNPFSTEFMEIEVLSNGKILVIENYYEYENEGKSNLYCLNQNMELEWFSPRPHNSQNRIDNYVGFTTNGHNIFANTFSCYRVEIDSEKGNLKNIQFTK